MSKDKRLLELPDWWIGKNGSEIVMPKFRLGRSWSPTGKQVEEMIFNCMHNKNYTGNQVQQYFGTTKPKDVMQKWNNDIRLYRDTDPVVEPWNIKPRSKPFWKRYHEYVATEGVPIFHEDFDKRFPIRPSRSDTYFAPDKRGSRYQSPLTFAFGHYL
jgi:hypothetical protein